MFRDHWEKGRRDESNERKETSFLLRLTLQTKKVSILIDSKMTEYEAKAY